MNVDEAVMKRKSVRSYQDKAVSAEDIATVIKAGQWAPNAGAYTMSVVRNKDLMAKINEKTLEAMRASGNDFLMERAALPGYMPLYGGPVVILLSGPSDMPITQLNCAVAVENMLLQATALGLGSCFLRSPCYALNNPANAAMAREAGIPEGSQMECGMVFGYVDDETKFARMVREPRGTVTYVD
jgi:FMN reductase [NAD(P)H]